MIAAGNTLKNWRFPIKPAACCSPGRNKIARHRSKEPFRPSNPAASQTLPSAGQGRQDGSDQRCPSRLVIGPQASAGVGMKVLVE